MNRLTVRDTKGRPLIIINQEGKIILGRYEDFTNVEVEEIISVYKEIGGTEEDRIRRFLKFEEEIEAFCS